MRERRVSQHTGVVVEEAAPAAPRKPTRLQVALAERDEARAAITELLECYAHEATGPKQYAAWQRAKKARDA